MEIIHDATSPQLNTYCNVLPSWIIAQSVGYVISEAFGQVVHELCSLGKMVH